LIVPALVWPRTRPWAFAVATLFHVANGLLFQIGVFPWFMILATVVFFPAELPLIIPFRHLIYAGDVNWNEQGHQFAWRMMLRGKRCGVRLYATGARTTKTEPVDLRRYVNGVQVVRFGRDPSMIHQLARHVATDLAGPPGEMNVEVRALAWVSLNGRKPQLMIDPTVDLAAQPRTWGSPHWVLPLTEPIRVPPWNLPLVYWEQALRAETP
jgi:hypothetical protein